MVLQIQVLSPPPSLTWPRQGGKWDQGDFQRQPDRVDLPFKRHPNMKTGTIKKQRPLSPHLQVYRPQITSVLSILHRMMGVAMSMGAILLVYWLASAAYGPEPFGRAQALFGSWFGRLVLFGLTFSLFFHLGNGIRHLVWDAGHGFELPTLRASGIAVVIFSLALTLLTWAFAYMQVGAL